jgi:CheY-like chemotaxis protein
METIIPTKTLYEVANDLKNTGADITVEQLKQWERRKLIRPESAGRSGRNQGSRYSLREIKKIKLMAGEGRKWHTLEGLEREVERELNRVLVIDNDFASRWLLQDELRDCRVETAYCAQGVHNLLSRKYALVVLDPWLPLHEGEFVMNTSEGLALLRSALLHGHHVIITATSRETPKEYGQEGIRGVFVKPFELSAFSRAAREALLQPPDNFLDAEIEIRGGGKRA